MDTPFIRVEDTGEMISLRAVVTTVGRGRGVDIRLDDPSVSRLHAELVRRGPYVYVTDLGLSRNGTRVNGRPVARRVLDDGDVLSFGSARCRVGGIPREDLPEEISLRRAAVPELTRREYDVLISLCRPALSDQAFALPATAHEIADDLVVTEAAVKQHLLRLYQKFQVPEGPNRRTRLANEVVALGLVRPIPVAPIPAAQIPAAPTPSGAAPSGAAPSGVAPSGAAPSGAAPSGVAPSGAVPSGPTPAGPIAAGPTPAGPIAAGPAPAAETGQVSGVPAQPTRRRRKQT